MSDKLTEALAWHTGRLSWLAKSEPEAAVLDTIEAAARRWASFPTDTDVEAGAGALSKNDGIEVLDWHRDLARAVLEAVKREDR